MNDLQLALLGAGVALVAAVWGYNLWQERKHKKLAEGIFGGGQADVLLDGQGGGERVEPSVVPAGDGRIEPAVMPQAADEPQALPAPPAAWADEIADCALHVELVDAVAAPDLWAAQASWADRLGKPVAWLGYDVPTHAWRRLSAHDAGRYGHVVAALQLADRQGAVSAEELALFLDGVQRVAQAFGGLVELPARHEVLAHAQSLDQFCAGVDVQLSVNVVAAAGGVIAGTKLRGLAEAAGMALAADGRFHACSDDGAELFSLGNVGAEPFDADTLKTLATAGVSFVLDVPRVADGPAVFDRMVGAARQMADALGGALADAQRHGLSDATIAGIRAKIGEIQGQMEANRIPPGSPRALRLFS